MGEKIRLRSIKWKNWKFMELKNSRIEIVKEIILQAFSYLKAEGYIQDFKMPSNSTSIEVIDSEYVNVSKRRKITVTYSMGEFKGEIVYVFDLIIVRDPYTHVTEDYFSLSVYLKSLDIDFDTRMVNNFDYKKATMIVNRIAENLKTYALRLVKGDKWIEGYYPKWD